MEKRIYSIAVLFLLYVFLPIAVIVFYYGFVSTNIVNFVTGITGQLFFAMWVIGFVVSLFLLNVAYNEAIMHEEIKFQDLLRLLADEQNMRYSVSKGVSGKWSGKKVRVFEFKKEMGNIIQKRSAVAVEYKKGKEGLILLGRKNLISKASNDTKLKEVKFKDYSFSKHYSVRAKKPLLAKKIFNKKLREKILDLNDSDLDIEISNGTVTYERNYFVRELYDLKRIFDVMVLIAKHAEKVRQTK